MSDLQQRTRHVTHYEPGDLIAVHFSIVPTTDAADHRRLTGEVIALYNSSKALIETPVGKQYVADGSIRHENNGVREFVTGEEMGAVTFFEPL